MENSEQSAIESFKEIINLVDAMDSESFSDTVRAIVGYYVNFFGREVIRPQKSMMAEFPILRWSRGDNEIYTSATIYSEADTQTFSLGIRLMYKEDIEDLHLRLKNLGDGFAYKFPEIIIDYTNERGFEACVVVSDLSRPDDPSIVYAYANDHTVETLHPSGVGVENLLYRVQKHAKEAFYLSAFSMN